MATTTNKRPRMSAAEREAAHAERIQRAEAMLQELTTSEGFAAWVKLRKQFRQYSFGNQLLIIQQARKGLGFVDGTPFEPSLVMPAWKWKRLDNPCHPVKGSRGLLVWTPMQVDKKDRQGNVVMRDGKPVKKTIFILKPTFDRAQVIGFDGSEPPRRPDGIDPQPLHGDSHEIYIDVLRQWALANEALKLDEIAIEPIDGIGGALGYHHPAKRKIAVSDSLEPNAQLKTLIHEIAHAHGVDYETFDRAEAEVIVECAAWCVCDSIGLDTSSYSIPYIAGWGKTSAVSHVRAAALLIDQIAKSIEDALLADSLDTAAAA